MRKFVCFSRIVVVAAVACVFFSACGSSSGGGGDGGGGGGSSGNTLVDPYIVGAVLFEDVNGDGVQDTGDQTSTTTDANGAFSFTNSLTADSIIRLTSTKGTHNGVAYTGEITTTVSDAAASQVVSPLTTLLTNGWTAQDIIDVLTTAGMTGITADDLTKDPMAAFNITDTLASITDEKLARIQSTMAIYEFLSIIDGVIKAGYVSDLGTNGFTLTYELFTAHPHQAALVANMVSQIKMGLSRSVMETVSAALDAAKAACAASEDVTISDILSGSVAISNHVIPMVVESCGTSTNGIPDCNWAPDPAYFNTWSTNLGQSFYVIRTASNICTIGGVAAGYLPNVLDKTYCTLDGATDAAAVVTCH